MDDDGNRKIDLYEFGKGLGDYGLRLTPEVSPRGSCTLHCACGRLLQAGAGSEVREKLLRSFDWRVALRCPLKYAHTGRLRKS